MTSTPDAKPKDRIALAIACFVFGVFMDFVFNGLLKIVWLIIYGLSYVTIGTTLNSYLVETRFVKHTRLAMSTLLLGALAGHLTLAGHQDVRRFSMILSPSPFQNAPLAMKAKELAETLYVSSDKLQEKFQEKLSLHSSPTPQEAVPVTVRVTTHYGCIQLIQVDEIDGVAINSDPAASWTWKIDRNTNVSDSVHLGWGDEYYFWCRKPS
jgi:hypothetical protein